MEKIYDLLEEILELETDEFDEETKLEDIDAWDSLAKLSLMAMAKKDFGKLISGDTMKGFEKVGDIIAFLK